uniref:Uncharacterized protein n=1 Tax=Arundo donax TaxID=35708 RepID=A0A0A9CDN5_ARUDO
MIKPLNSMQIKKTRPSEARLPRGVVCEREDPSQGREKATKAEPPYMRSRPL